MKHSKYKNCCLKRINNKKYLKRNTNNEKHKK